MRVKIPINNAEILKSKFQRTLAKLQGYTAEADAYIGHNVTYSASHVANRMKNIFTEFQKDIENFASEMEVVTGRKDRKRMNGQQQKSIQSQTQSNGPA